jgi:uncharacterized protein
MREDVEFRAEDGVVLRGRLHSRDGEAAPGIVMAHGFGGVQDQIDHYAVRFATAGFSVLVYDHRGFGLSDGLPRQEVDPYRQRADWRDAISFATTRKEFRAEAPVGLWGSSFAGGLAMTIAATDPRVCCVVAQIPNVSGHRNVPKIFDPDQMAELRQRIALDRAARLAGDAPAMIKVFPTRPGELAVFLHGLPEGMIELAAAAPHWHNEVTLRSVENLLDFEPAGWMPYVAPKPLMMILAEEDVCTHSDIQRDVFEKLPGPKELVTYPGGHFGAYRGFFRETAEPAIRWFESHLRPAAMLAGANNIN